MTVWTDIYCEWCREPIEVDPFCCTRRAIDAEPSKLRRAAAWVWDHVKFGVLVFVLVLVIFVLLST